MPPARLLRFITALVTILVVGAFAVAAWSDYRRSLKEAEGELTEVTRLLEEHTRAALLAGTLTLSRIADHIGDRPLASLEGSEEDWRAIRRYVAEVPFADSAWVFDDNADLRASSYRPEPVKLNVGDRAYFADLAGGAVESISPMIWGKLYGGYYFAMARRLPAVDGGFRGAVQISLRASYFTDFYSALRPAPGAAFAILKDDGRVVVRYPLPEGGAETFSQPRRLLEELTKADSGTFVAVSHLDGVERLLAYRRLGEEHLVVTAGVPYNQVLAGWRDRTQRNGVLAAGVLAAFLAFAVKLSDTLRSEGQARARAEALLADKQVLFQEIHHRVKNNLQIISSFLTMQAIQTPDPRVASAFEDSLSRIHSMGLVHQILYEQDEASEVSMDSYLRALADSVGRGFGGTERGIAIDIHTDGTRLPLDTAVPLALLANEALTNALKHAFPAGRPGRIAIDLRRTGDRLAFSVADDGIGMDPAATSGLGMHILQALARQLGGTLDLQGGAGTRVSVTFPA